MTTRDEIKNASKLIVGPGQGCIFVYEGKVAGVYLQQGIVDLRTQNIPFWTTITKFMQAFVSEHKVGLFFFKQAILADLKWGTSSAIKYEDPKYKFPVGLRAYGNFSAQIKKPDWFFQNILGAQDVFTTNDLRELVLSRMTQPMTDYLAQAKFTYTEIDSHRTEIAKHLNQDVGPEFETLCFSLIDFRVEGTSFDDETMARINRIADMSAEAQAASAAGLNYAQLQQLDALKSAAKNPGGAGMVMGMGVGMGLGNQMSAGIGAIGNEDAATRLKKLKGLLGSKGLSTKPNLTLRKNKF